MSRVKFTDKLIDEVAKAIYHREGGMSDKDYEAIYGKSRKRFDEPPMVFVPPEFRDWLCEHERDEYRWQARGVLELLTDRKLLRIPQAMAMDDL